jgi:hypothetical protein
VRIAGGNQQMGLNDGAYGQLTRPIFEELRKGPQALSGLFASSAHTVRVGRGNDTRRMHGIELSGNCFSTLGVRVQRGRLLLPEDEGARPSSRAVVSYSYWQNEMGGRDLDAATGLVVNGEFQAGDRRSVS